MPEDMHHITKAVGFTGKTIKRWLATSPRKKSNAQQTDSVTAPTTPARPEIGPSIQQERLQHHVDAPQRNKSIVVKLCATPSSLSPSLLLEESQTPSQSPKVVSESSVDDSETTASTDPTTVADGDDLAAALAAVEDPIIVSLSFINGNEFRIVRNVISLDTSTDDLIALVRELCTRWRRAKTHYMRFLKARGQGVHMVAGIRFGDQRDHYVNGSHGGLSRFETLRDMFEDEELDFLQTTGEPAVLPMFVSIGPCDLDDGEGITEMPPSPQQARQWAYHRVASWQHTRKTASSQHSPLQHSAYARYNKTTCKISKGLLEVREREVNGLTIGSFDQGFPHITLPGPHVLEPHYQTANMANHNVHEMIARNVTASVICKREEPSQPHLPAMTFNDALMEVDTDSIPNDPIHLAIRIVNGLPGLQHIPLPVNFLMIVHPGKGTCTVMKKKLTNALYDYGCQCQDLGIEQMFRVRKDENGVTEGMWNAHEVEFWVLPQREEGRERKNGRMYTFERGSLKWYLDPEMVAQGNRKLYVEAWILPGEDGDEEWDAESDGEDDGEDE